MFLSNMESFSLHFTDFSTWVNNFRLHQRTQAINLMQCRVYHLLEMQQVVSKEAKVTMIPLLQIKAALIQPAAIMDTIIQVGSC